MGQQVVIRTVPDITINDYVIGDGLTAQYPSSNSVTLSIDKGKNFNVAINTVQAFQSDLDLVGVFTNAGSIQLQIEVDRDLLSGIYGQVSSDNQGANAGKESGNINLGTAGSPVSIDQNNVVDWLTYLGQVLDEQNVPNEGRWVVLPPWVINAIKRSDLRIASLAGDNVSILRNGMVGQIDRFDVYLSNNVHQSTSGEWVIMFGHPAALAFAAQITQMEMVQNPNDFGYLARGLMVYGYRVTGPDYIGTSIIEAAS